MELARLRDKIQDLLPAAVAARLLEAPPPPPPPSPGPAAPSPPGVPAPLARLGARRGARSSAAVTTALGQRWRSACERYTAVVVQLDICRFTELSGSMSAMEVAEMVHALFSAFDAAVSRRGLFKMDTVRAAAASAAAAAAAAAAGLRKIVGDAAVQLSTGVGGAAVINPVES